MPPLQRLLIANRGEIACRIARTARRMGITSIAAFSQADAGALHVRACDEAVAIGGDTAARSYLDIEALVEAARRTQAQAVHPGYGFLSENAAFAQACEERGLIFVGPPASAIRLMGSKAAARALMDRAGVALTPGYHGEEQDPKVLQAQAERIGYPILIKASAGAGGRGIRQVDRAQDFAAALVSCQREAAASFGDERMLIEKFIQRPRHIEIQVFADREGRCIHLFERDCSVQRRHQKVLEEAPAPGMTAERRAAMGAAAVSAASAVGYVGAGTVEFIAAPDGAFYFMEMNTRLQVEHPVTEMITGTDLVEWQLRIAAGEGLPRTQAQLSMRGHAIEARIAAEDPDRGFLPATGRLSYYAMPPDSAHVRVDSGVTHGSQVTPYYDSMMAKLIVWDEDRARALARMRAALRQVHLVGVANNVDFLGHLVASPAFVAADLDTSLIEREHHVLFEEREVPREVWLLACIAVLVPGGCGPSPWDAHDGWRLGARAQRQEILRAGATTRTVQVHYQAQGWTLSLEGHTAQARAQRLTDSILRVSLDGLEQEVTVVRQAAAVHVFWQGRTFVLERVNRAVPVGHEASPSGLRAPMPGRILALLAMPGAIVVKGAPLLVLEAMKIEHTVTAPGRGVLKGFRVAAGDQVIEGAALIDFEPATD